MPGTDVSATRLVGFVGATRSAEAAAPDAIVNESVNVPASLRTNCAVKLIGRDRVLGEAVRRAVQLREVRRLRVGPADVVQGDRPNVPETRTSTVHPPSGICRRDRRRRRMRGCSPTPRSTDRWSGRARVACRAGTCARGRAEPGRRASAARKLVQRGTGSALVIARSEAREVEADDHPRDPVRVGVIDRVREPRVVGLVPGLNS